MNYTVRKVKSFRGMEGFGMNAELLKDGKPVAFVIDEGNGGEMNFEWYDHKAPRVEVNGIGFGGETIKFKGTPEEADLYAFCATIPPTPSEYEWNKGNMNYTTPDIYIEGLVAAVEEQQRLKKAAKTKTMFTVNGVEYSINAPYTPAIKVHLEAKYPTGLKILNTEFVSEADADAAKRKKADAKMRRMCKMATLFLLAGRQTGKRHTRTDIRLRQHGRVDGWRCVDDAGYNDGIRYAVGDGYWTWHLSAERWWKGILRVYVYL